MIKQIVFLVTIISILVTKQASSQSFECINIEDPDWMQGSEILIQTIDSVEVTLLMEEGRAREKVFNLKISNTSSKKFTFDPDSIYVIGYYRDTVNAENKKFKSFDPEKIIEDISSGASEEDMDYWKNTAFRKTTIKSGYHHEGKFHMKVPSFVMFKVYIPVNDETFEFIFLEKGYTDKEISNDTSVDIIDETF